MPRSAGIYDRQSRADEPPEEVVWRIDACREWATRNGWVVHDTYQDLNKSGWKRTVKRPDWERLLADIKEGRVDGVICHSQDRLFRQDLERLRFYETATGAGMHLVAEATGGVIDLKTAAGRKDFRDRGSAAEYYSDVISEKTRERHAKFAEKGRWIGGNQRPFGYNVVKRLRRQGEGRGAPEVQTIQPHETEAKLLRSLAARVLRGESLTRITRELNEKGITPTGGHRWTTGNLRRVLLNPVNAGLRLHGRTKLETEGEWEPILDSETHTLLKARLNGNGAPKTGGRAKRNPLVGLVKCGRCGQPMLGSKEDYRCATIAGGCGKVRVSSERLEELVFADVYIAHGEDDRPSPVAPDSVELTDEERSLLADITKLEERKTLLAEDYVDVDRVMSREQFRAANTKLDEKIKDLRAKLRVDAPRKPSAPTTFGQLVEDAEDYRARARRRELTDAEVQDAHEWAAAYVESVVVAPGKPGRRFDESRVKITMRRNR